MGSSPADLVYMQPCMSSAIMGNAKWGVWPSSPWAPWLVADNVCMACSGTFVDHQVTILSHRNSQPIEKDAQCTHNKDNDVETRRAWAPGVPPFQLKIQYPALVLQLYCMAQARNTGYGGFKPSLVIYSLITPCRATPP